ncbi:hypothetical protein B0I37DRAFT_193685 [Chaetomium sp. MPI-CAGE-AT-0009]|nr:hypothetical protein B0I37DRAFT_193685 [Chaetomium sp. MPI-CAGE-AT-0009]
MVRLGEKEVLMLLLWSVGVRLSFDAGMAEKLRDDRDPERKDSVHQNQAQPNNQPVTNWDVAKDKTTAKQLGIASESLQNDSRIFGIPGFLLCGSVIWTRWLACSGHHFWSCFADVAFLLLCLPCA